MSDPFLAEIKIFAGNFAPRGWSFCDGQLLQIAQNTALFSLIGTTYGGDGRTTTGLPNLQGRVPMHPGNGPGLTSRRLGERGGVTSVTLAQTQMPSHTHQARATDENGDDNDAIGGYFGTGSALYGPATGLTDMESAALPNVGGGQSHTNVQPLLGMYFIIALTGSYPSRA